MSFTLNILSGPKKSRHTFDESSLYLFGSNQSLSETGKRFIEETNNDVLILSNLQIFGDFLKYMAAPNNITISESCHDLIVYKSMQNSELKYFDKMKHWPAIKNEFAKAISKIKRNCISSTELCKMLEKGGSDKENDLLRVYTKYEQIQSELNFLDPADLYIQAIQNLNNRTCEVLTKFDSIYFDLSIKLDYDILNLIKEINNNYENIKIEIDTLNKHDSEIIEAFGKISDIKIHNCGDVNTSNISHYALPTPEQELNYIVDSIISLVNSGTDPQQIGILLRKPHSLFSRIALLLSDRGLGQGAFKDNHLILKKLSQHIMSQITDFKKEGTITEYCKFINKLTDDYIKKASLTEKFNVTTLSIPAIKEIKGINDWNDIINKLTFADELGEIGKIKVNHFLEILEDELSHKPIYYENFRTPIKFYTFEDAPTIDVKHLFIPNFDSDNYPRITSVGYFFNEPDLFDNPYQSTLNHFKTAPENDFNVELSLFNWILMNQNTKIILTMSSYNSLGNELSASPLSYNIQEPEHISSYKPNSSIVRNDLPQRIKIENERKINSPFTPEYHGILENSPSMDDIRQGLDARTFSNSQLKEYATCPFTFFTQRLLNIDGDEDEPPDGKPKDKGKIVHLALETILKENTSLLIDAITDISAHNKLISKVEAHVNNAIESERESIRYISESMIGYLKDYFINTVKTLINTEITILKGLPFKVYPKHFELFFGIDNNPPLIINHLELKKDIKIRGVIDRIDVDEATKEIVIYDYKSGNTTSVVSAINNELHLQLPLYCKAVKQIFKDYKIAGAFLISLKNNSRDHGIAIKGFNTKLFFVGSRSKSLLAEEDFESINEKAINIMKHYITEMYRGYFAANPKDCQHYCGWKDICRYEYRKLT